MAAKLTISLRDLRFYAFHGLYAEERRTGNEFRIDLSVTFPAPPKPVTVLEASINYSSLNDLVKDEMQHPRELLETFAMELAERIYSIYPMITRVEIRIDKLHPPIAGFSGNVGVTYLKEF